MKFRFWGSEELPGELFRVGAIKDKSKSPGGMGFRLKLHEKNPGVPPPVAALCGFAGFAVISSRHGRNLFCVYGDAFASGDSRRFGG